MTAIFLFAFAELVLSQDVILKKDNTTILSKVLEINSTEVKYKKWSNQDGPTYSISRYEVTSINYQNGEVEKFNNQETPKKSPETQSATTYQQTQTQTSKSETKPKHTSSPYSRGFRINNDGQIIPQFSISVGAAIPMGTYGANNNICAPYAIYDNPTEIGNGGAKTGFLGTICFHVPVYAHDKDIVGVVIKDRVLFNSLSDDAKKKSLLYWNTIASEMNEDFGVYGYHYDITKYPSYFNMAIMAGVDYTHYFSKSFGLFAEANIGLNVSGIFKSQLTNLKGGTYLFTQYENNYGYVEYYSPDGANITYKPKANFTYEIGAGFFLFDHLSIGLYYLGFTPYQVSLNLTEYSNKYDGDDYGDGLSSIKLKVSALSLQLGIHF